MELTLLNGGAARGHRTSTETRQGSQLDGPNRTFCGAAAPEIGDSLHSSLQQSLLCTSGPRHCLHLELLPLDLKLRHRICAIWVVRQVTVSLRYGTVPRVRTGTGTRTYGVGWHFGRRKCTTPGCQNADFYYCGICDTVTCRMYW